MYNAQWFGALHHFHSVSLCAVHISATTPQSGACGVRLRIYLYTCVYLCRVEKLITITLGTHTHSHVARVFTLYRPHLSKINHRLGGGISLILFQYIIQLCYIHHFSFHFISHFIYCSNALHTSNTTFCSPMFDCVEFQRIDQNNFMILSPIFSFAMKISIHFFTSFSRFPIDIFFAHIKNCFNCVYSVLYSFLFIRVNLYGCKYKPTVDRHKKSFRNLCFLDLVLYD